MHRLTPALSLSLLFALSSPAAGDPFEDLLLGAARAVLGSPDKPAGGDAFVRDGEANRRANDAASRDAEERMRRRCAGQNTTFCAPFNGPAGAVGQQGANAASSQSKAGGQAVAPVFTHTVAAGMPDCTNPEVHKLAIQAVYRDMRKLRLLDGPDLEMERLIGSFQNSTSQRAQLIFRSLPASYGMDESYVQVCEPPNSDVPYAIIIMNPKNQQWGLAVGDFGVPGLSAEIRLEFLAGR